MKQEIVYFIKLFKINCYFCFVEIPCFKNKLLEVLHFIHIFFSFSANTLKFLNENTLGGKKRIFFPKSFDQNI